MMHSGRSVAIFVILVGLACPAFAQEHEQPAKAPDTKAVEAQSQPRDRGQAMNVRLDVTITDQQSAAEPAVKTLTMLAADNSWSRVRTEGVAWTTGGQYSISLRLDARPRILQGDKLHLEMTVEYKPTAPEPKPGASATTLSESFDVVLDSGKPLVISQSADPNSDRKVKLEVKATVLR